LVGRVVIGVAVAGYTLGVDAQHATHHADSARRLTVGAMATVVTSHLTPGALRADVTEGYLTQPMVIVESSGHRFGGQLRVRGVLNLERLTLRRGEITPGVYGEGYVDRRHPHTTGHELMAGYERSIGRASEGTRWSLFAGKGFVPFGSDDPMTRPFVKFPANHHLAQVLERALVTAAVRWRGAAIEHARFNGDEPEGTSDWPNGDRLFDSWSVRATWWPREWIEVAASYANVQSPEFATGEGLDQRKRSAVLRLERPQRRLSYGLVEFARTVEFSGDRRVFEYSSLLAEAEWASRGNSLSLRVERTERPEEERTQSFYRSIRPLLDFNVLGKTRWTTASAHVERTVRVGPARWTPFVEVARSVPRAAVRPTALDPVDLFGARQLWMYSAGVRLHAGRMPGRFGRYGAAVRAPASAEGRRHGAAGARNSGQGLDSDLRATSAANARSRSPATLQAQNRRGTDATDHLATLRGP
jgi:hypothetical protein